MGSHPMTVAGCSSLPPLVGSGQVASQHPDSTGIAIAHVAGGSHGLAQSSAAPTESLRRALFSEKNRRSRTYVIELTPKATTTRSLISAGPTEVRTQYGTRLAHIRSSELSLPH